MRAMAIERFGGAEELRPLELERPRSGPGEVLIRIVAAGVDALDLEIRAGRLPGGAPHAFPLVPGWEAAGVVEALGVGATRWRRGERVFACARKPRIQWGCYAEYVSVPETQVAGMPARLLYEEAAALPLAGLGALAALGDPRRLAGRRVLLTAGAGSAGKLALEIARSAGAGIWCTRDAALEPELGGLAGLRVLGEAESADGFDVVVRATPGAPPSPDGERLELLARLVESAGLRPRAGRILPLEQAAEAHRLVESTPDAGKPVLGL